MVWELKIIFCIVDSCFVKQSRTGGVFSSDDVDVSSSDEVTLSLPQLEKCPIVSLACHFASLSSSYETEKTHCDKSMDCACGVIAVEWQVSGKDVSSPTVRKFIVRWSSDKDPTQRSVSLPANTHCYDIQSPLQRYDAPLVTFCVLEFVFSVNACTCSTDLYVFTQLFLVCVSGLPVWSIDSFSCAFCWRSL